MKKLCVSYLNVFTSEPLAIAHSVGIPIQTVAIEFCGSSKARFHTADHGKYKNKLYLSAILWHILNTPNFYISIAQS